MTSTIMLGGAIVYWIIGFAQLKGVYKSLSVVENIKNRDSFEAAIDKLWVTAVLLWPIMAIAGMLFKAKIKK